METGAEITAAPNGEQVEEGPDGRAEKKRKFKPFEAMRKFFRSSRKRSKLKEEDGVNIVSLKAKSTSELVSQQIQEEADDGGFKSHKTLSQTRSISEDSIFNPDPKDPKKANIEAFTKGAKSVENINQNFKSELATKLKKRQSFHSDDDGLPKSPMSSFTTADVIMGGLKATTSGKSASRESDKSLLSVGSSDNEEEDLFQTNWKASVASVVTRRSKTAQSTDTAMEFDLSAVQPTTALKSDAAKHRISVAPKTRKAHRHKKPQSQKMSNPSSLPKLTEESPSKVSTEEEVFQLELSAPGTKEGTDKPVTVPVKPSSSEKLVPEKPAEVSISKSPETKPSVSGKPTVSKKLSGDKSEEIVPKTTAPSAAVMAVPKTAAEELKVVEKTQEKKEDSEKDSELFQVRHRLRKTSGKKMDEASQDSDKENMSEEASGTQKSPEVNKQKPAAKQPVVSGKLPELKSPSKKLNSLERGTELPSSKTSEVKADKTSKGSEGPATAPVELTVTKQPLRPTLSAPVDNSSSKDKEGEASKAVSAKPIHVEQNEAEATKADKPEPLSTPGESNVKPSERVAVRSSLISDIKSSLGGETKPISGSAVKPSLGGGIKPTVSDTAGVRALGGAGSSPSPPPSDVKDTEKPEAKDNAETSATKRFGVGLKTVSSTTKTTTTSTTTDSTLGLQRLASPKEEYKQKRQGRSKTLPEQPFAKEVVRNSVTPPRNDYDNVTFVGKNPQIEEEKSKTAKENGVSSPKTIDKKPKEVEKLQASPPSSPPRQAVITTAAKRPEPKRLSLKSGLVSDSSEPIWVAMARRKKQDTTTEEQEETKKESSETKKPEVSDSKKEETTQNRTNFVKPTTQSQTSVVKNMVPTSPSKTPFKETKINTKVSPPPEVKTASKPILIENKPPGKVEPEDKTSSSGSTDSRSVLVNKPPVKFVRNISPSKPNTTPTSTTTNKPGLGKSFVVEKPAQMTTKPLMSSSKSTAETWKVSAAKSDNSSSQKSFTIDKSSLGNTVPPISNSSGSNNTKPDKTEKKEETKPSSVPAWRSNLQKKKEPTEIKVPEMKKIEIIEKSAPITSTKPVPAKSTDKVPEETPAVILREKAKVDKCSDVASARSSKVLDMVKNYQKLQVS